jgi:hypothetical protein
MVEYVESESAGKAFDRYRYGADPNDRATLLLDGAARLKRIAAPHVRYGEIYSCDTRVVHTVVPTEVGVTATLIVRGPHTSPSTVVYCEPGRDTDQPNQPMAESDFRLLVKHVVTELRKRITR